MALDTLDFSVLLALALAVVAYFAKDYIFPPDKNEGGFLTESATGSRDLLETVKKNNKNAIIFFGSQTGTAEDYANKLSKELSSRFGLKTITIDFADYEYDNLDNIDNNILCFFILATYGEGEPTDNAIDFVNYLQNEADTLSTLRYTVFGLGNSTYEFYNAVANQVDEKLEAVGADRFAEKGLGDDGKGTLDEDFLAWKDNVFETLKNDLNFEEHEMVYEPSFKIEEVDELSGESISHGEPSKKYVVDNGEDLTKGPFNNTHPYIAPIVQSKELFHSKDRSCVHIDFDISGSNLRYSTGDHLAIWPSNSVENIERFNKAFGFTDEKLETAFSLKSLDTTVHIPFYTPITYGAVVKHKLEISGPISRQFLLAVAQFAPSADAKELAIKLGNDKQVFAEKITGEKLNVADALLYLSNGLPWTSVPFEFIIEFIPHLQPRYYSISLSSLTEKTNIHVTAVVEAEFAKDGHPVTGVVTNLLKNIEIEQNKTGQKPTVHYDLSGPHNKFSNFKLPVHVRRSTFKLPSSLLVPVIMIGPGTGVAPFRGFIRERVTQVLKNDQKIGETLLFYGCRNEDEDFLYKEEWSTYAKTLGLNFELFTAFSRQVAGKKVYVQDRLLESSARINKLLQSGAYIYVCGDASRMAREVQSTLVKIIATEREISSEKAAELVRSFKVQNRYQEDVW